MADSTFIYALLDPVSNEVRYIGKSDDPQRRFSMHIVQSRYEKNHRAHWIRQLTGKGLKPLLEVVDEVPSNYWEAIESAYIIFFKEDMGCLLVNGTPGGDSLGSGENHPVFGKAQSLEHRAKIAVAQMGSRNHRYGKHNSPEHHAKLIAVNTGRACSPETREKIRVSNKGKKRSEEWRRKMSAAKSGPRNHNFGKQFSMEHRSKMSAAMKGRRFSLEHRRKLSEAKQGDKHHWFGKRLPLETVKRMSAARSRWWAARKAKPLLQCQILNF